MFQWREIARSSSGSAEANKPRGRHLWRAKRVFSAFVLTLGVFTAAGFSVLIGALPASAATALTCTTPASGGSSQSFIVGTTNSTYAVACYEQTGVSGTPDYPSSITLN